MIVKRRDFIKAAALGTAGVWANSQAGDYILAEPSRPAVASLIETIAVLCRRLTDYGWRDLLLQVTSGELDITAANLSRELSKRITTIRRNLPGFEDFAAEGYRGIEPGNPARSLLFHAFASPAVTQGAQGKPLTDFPTPAELEAVENFVYGVVPPTIEGLRVRADGARLAIVVLSE